jgi:mannose-6-phosphate isomerase-like protein (cupin superfamily)
MSHRIRTLALVPGIVGMITVAAFLGQRAVMAADLPKLVKSGIVSFDDAKAQQADWGGMRRYFTGETAGTKDVLTAVAIVKPGKAVHRAHRHADEEYLILAEGSGTWSLDGKESPAKRGDILYAEPWVYHGLTNTGTDQLIFVVLRFNSKGVKLPPRPDTRPDEQ